jgi:hypothetical protein
LLKFSGYLQFYDKFERNQLIKAADIASYQYPLASSSYDPDNEESTINGFNVYADNGNEFIILKAGNQSTSNSTAIKDDFFTIENVNKFKDSKLKIGTYWYCRHLNVNIQTSTYPGGVIDANIIAEATLEANNYADTLESVFGTGDCGDIIPALDFEDNRFTLGYEWTAAQLFLYMKTFKDTMCSRFPQLNIPTGGKGIMLYTGYYYIDQCSTTHDVRDGSGNGIVTEIPALWFAANTSDIGAMDAGYNGEGRTCGITNYSTTINVTSTYQFFKYDEIVVIDANKNIIGNGKITAVGSNSLTYNGVKVTTDANCKVVKSTPYPTYNLTAFGGYGMWMLWQYSSDTNRLGKQYSTSTVPIDLDVFDSNNFSMNEILCYPNTKPKLIEILEDKADKTHSHIGQYVPTNGGTFDGETTTTAPIPFIFKQEQQKSFKLSRNNTDFKNTSKATKMFLTPSIDNWVPGGDLRGGIWEPNTGVTWDSYKSVGVGTDGFIYHNQVNTDGYIYGTLPAAGWYRVAQCPTAVLTSTGTFTFRNNNSGDRSCGKFIATSTYGSTSTSLIQLAYNKYTTNCITQARLVFQDQSYCYLELYHNAAVSTTLEIILTDNLNWSWTPFNTDTITFANGSVPALATERILTFSNGLVSSADIETYGQLKSTIVTGTAPLVVASTTKVNNLNVSLLNGLADTDFIKKDGTVSMTGPLTLSADPTLALQASTKQYVDSIAAGFKTKDSCLVATTGNITLSGEQTIDGVGVVVGNRVLVWQQTNAVENGIYVVSAGAWTRATDFDSSGEITAGAYSFVTSGSTYINNGFTVTTSGTITPDVTAFNFTISTGAGTITAGTGLTKVANTLNIANTAVTPDTYKSITVNAQGQVTAGTNPTTLAGYGITDAADVNHNHTSINGSASTLTTARNITITGDASGTASFDGSTDISIAITMTGGNVYANVKAFGAVGNGITNDSSAIQSALDSLSVSGGTIIFPQGTYAIGTPLEVCSNTKITGVGNVILKRITTDNNIMHNKSDGNTGGYDANVNISIDNIKFDANNTVSGVFDCTSLAFGHATNINVTNCEFYNNDGWHCLELNGVKDAVIDGCFFHDYGDSTQQANASEMLQLDLMKSATEFPWFGPYDNVACDNVIIQNCRFIGNVGTDLSNSTYYRAIGNHTYLANYQPKNIVITHNIFENLPCCIRLDDVITLSICYNMCSNVYYGILFEPHANPTSNVIVEGNRYSGLFNSASGTYSDSRFLGINPAGDNTIGSNSFVITNNVITSCHYHAIAGTLNNCVITNNVIDTCGRSGIYAFGGNGYNISNNRISNCVRHSGAYGGITFGNNGTTTNTVVSNNTVVRGLNDNTTAGILIGTGATACYNTCNVVPSIVNGTGSTGCISKANIINGTYTA